MSEVVALLWERREYAVVLWRFADGSSSSELGSGTARFFPFLSGMGSLMLSGRVREGELLRVLMEYEGLGTKDWSY